MEKKNRKKDKKEEGKLSLVVFSSKSLDLMNEKEIILNLKEFF